MHCCPGHSSKCLFLCQIGSVLPSYAVTSQSSFPAVHTLTLHLLSCVQPVKCSPLCSLHLSSSRGLPGRRGELPCSHSCRSLPPRTHSYRSAGLFHREKEKHGHRLRVLLVVTFLFFSFFLPHSHLYATQRNSL